MTFGVAMIQKPRRRNAGKSHDCGKHGRLRAVEIAAQTGLNIATVRQRIRDGKRGDALCAPAWEGLRRARVTSGRHVAVTACRLGVAFPDRVPSIAEIQAVRPMSRASAVRWRQVWREALGAP